MLYSKQILVPVNCACTLSNNLLYIYLISVQFLMYCIVQFKRNKVVFCYVMLCYPNKKIRLASKHIFNCLLTVLSKHTHV